MKASDRDALLSGWQAAVARAQTATQRDASN
jgi:hypothetical protein